MADSFFQQPDQGDSVETVVGPSVHVEGDFDSKGNIIVKGSVSGKITTSQHLRVEENAVVVASIKAATAEISGSIKGNVKVEGMLELSASAKIKGDVSAGVLIVAKGAALHGKCSMPQADFSVFKEKKEEKKPAAPVAEKVSEPAVA